MPNKTLSDRLQTKISKCLCKKANDHAFVFVVLFSAVGLGLLTIALAFFISYLPNILVVGSITIV